MDREEGKRKLTNPLEVLGRYKYVLLVVLLGALLLLWPGGRGAADRTDSGSRQTLPQRRKHGGRRALSRFAAGRGAAAIGAGGCFPRRRRWR